MSNIANNAAEQFIQYLNEENFEKAESCLDPEFKFMGVLGSRENASGENVCFWYHIDMGKKTILASGWYEVINGKIYSLKVLFDPRPLLDDQK